MSRYSWLVWNKCKDPGLFTYARSIDCDQIRHADRKFPIDQRTCEELMVDRSIFWHFLNFKNKIKQIDQTRFVIRSWSRAGSCSRSSAGIKSYCKVGLWWNWRMFSYVVAGSQQHETAPSMISSGDTIHGRAASVYGPYHWASLLKATRPNCELPNAYIKVLCVFPLSIQQPTYCSRLICKQ